MRRSTWLLPFLLAWSTPSVLGARAETAVPLLNGDTAQARDAGAIKTFRFGAPWETENHVTQGSRAGDTVYVAGQFSHDDAGTFVGEGDAAKQTRQTFANIDKVLAGLGASKDGILELEVFLVDPAKNHAAFIDEYKRYVGDGRLTVTLIGVTSLYYPKELVEIRAVAHAMR